KGKYEGSQMEGGTYFGYNEILFELPKSSKYPFPDISGGHWDSDRVLMHMRTTKRMLDDGSNGDEGYPASFHIEEMQSDWHQYGRGEGYADTAYINRVYDAEQNIKELQKKQKIIQKETYQKSQPLVEEFMLDRATDIEKMGQVIEQASGRPYETNVIINASKFKDYENVREIDMRLNGLWSTLNQLQRPNYEPKVESKKILKEIKKYNDKLDHFIDDWAELRINIDNQVSDATRKIDFELSEVRSITDQYEFNVEMGGFGQSPAPFKNSWQHRAFADAVQMAVEQGHTYLTWTTGKRSAEMARLDNTFESVEVRYTAKGYLKPDGSNKYAINAVGKDQFGENTIRKSVSESELKDLIGKDYAQEAITRLEKSDKPITANKVELTDIVVPHKGRRLLYDSILPSVAKRIAKTLGTRPPTKAKIILQENAIVPERGKKAGHKTQEVWVMELPVGKEKLHELQLYMPSMMPLQNIPAMPRSMKEGQTMYFAKPQIRIAPSKAS
ncbi:MAG: hypothetical protein EBR72_09345, partial [Bacteroidetes bacterium]|nr:hypothetical protein [Bacteroidota bacterium]